MPRTTNTHKKVSFTSALYPSQMKEITHLAEEYGTSQARVVRELIKLGLEKIQRGYLFTIAKEHD